MPSTARKNHLSPRHTYSGPVFLSQGFRPFFLGAAIWAPLALALWLGTWLGYAPVWLQYDVHWHMHEMLLGFVGAAMAGFLLTAIPNWTGRYPVRGSALGSLFALWVIGRVAMLLQPAFPDFPIWWAEALFLPVFALAIFREIIAGKNWRNLKMAAIVAGLAIANIWFQLEAYGALPARDNGMRAAIALILLTVALIGGRVTPSFTRNALKQRGSTILPSPLTNTDRFTLFMTLAFGIAYVPWPQGLMAGSLALVCAFLHLERLSRWRGLHVINEPMLWILHLAYLWLPVGFLLYAGAIVFQQFWQGAAIHAFTVGAFTSMIFAMMTRASRGHTGRELHANALTTGIYVSITMATLFRIVGAMMGGSRFHEVAGAFWIAAFALFLIGYAPILLGRDLRLDRFEE